MSRKFCWLTFALVCCLGTALAQSPRIFYTEPDKDDSRRTSFEIIGKLNNRFFIYKANRGEDAISIYDAELKLKEKIDLEFTPDQQMINTDFVAYANFFYMFYQYEKRNVVYCMAVKYDANGKKLTEPVELDTTHIGFANNNKIYTMVNSDDKQRIMLFKINSRKQDNFIFTTLLFDNQLMLLRKDRMAMAMEERNDFFSDFLLTNEGDLVFSKFIKSGGTDFINKAFMVIKYPDKSQFTITGIGFGERIIDDIKIKIDNNNKRVLFNAFYYKQRRGNIEGLYSVIWDKTSNAAYKETVLKFSDDLRMNARHSDASLRMAFDDYYIKNIIARKDGGFLLISEIEYVSTRGGNINRWDMMNYGWGSPWVNPYNSWYWSPTYGPYGNPWNRWNSSPINRHHAENMMILSFDKEGILEWNNIIAKSQYDDETDNMVSFAVMNTGDAIHFLFNLLERRNLMLNDHSLGGDGKVTRNPTLKNLDKGYEFMPRYGKQVAARQMIVPCVYRNYLCFARIDF
ncbi:MAG: hypothetical protein RLZZ316_102 [Bacteroidota bacterium]|jgi:hypothetical protein